jgi:hypothetical protein
MAAIPRPQNWKELMDQLMQLGVDVINDPKKINIVDSSANALGKGVALLKAETEALHFAKAAPSKEYLDFIGAGK